MGSDLVERCQVAVQEASGVRNKRLVLRDVLQACILAHLTTTETFNSVAFLGGTALRIIACSPRYSEDMDFSSVGPIEQNDFLKATARKVGAALATAGLPAEISVRSRTSVHSARVAFRGLSTRFGIPAHEDEKLMIKIEVDTQPPDAAGLTRSRVSRYGEDFEVVHHDLPTMFAGKLHAILSRAYDKGRDFYDLAFYLDRRVEPNLTFLNNALTQTRGTHAPVEPDTWRQHIHDRLRSVNWDVVQQDCARFLGHADQIHLTSQSLMDKLQAPDQG